MPDHSEQLYEMEYHKPSEIPPEGPTTLCIGVYKGYSYIITCNDGDYPRAFVLLPDDHPYRYLEDFDSSEFQSIRCHGGINYTEYDGTLTMFDDDYIYVPRGSWIGWDYGHSGDFNGHTPTVTSFAGVKRKKWTVKEVCKECESVIRQLASVKDISDSRKIQAVC